MKKLLLRIATIGIVGGVTASAAIPVVGCSDSDNNKSLLAQEYLDKITNKNVTLNNLTLDTDTKTPATANLITTKLVANNPALGTVAHATTILSYEGRLVQGSASLITVNAHIGTSKASITLSVTWNPISAQTYLDKITTNNITIKAPIIDVDSSTTATANIITTELVAKNPALGTVASAEAILSYTGTLTKNESVAITAKATIGSDTATKTINVMWEAVTPQQYLNKITDTDITIQGANIDPNTSKEVTANIITTELVAKNPALGTVASAEAILSYTGTLTKNESVAITAKATIDSDTATKTINVKWDSASSGNVLSGYWYNWDANKKVKIEDVNPAYNIVNVAFYSRAATSTSDLPVLDSTITNDKANIIAGIQAQHQKNHKVILSLGGANGDTKLSSSNVGEFETNTLAIVKEYGFDGLDIDWEGAAAKDTDNATYIVQALKKIKTELPNFMITMAPEFPNLRTGVGSIYPDIIKNLDGEYNYIQPQIYNQGGDGINVSEADHTAFPGIPYYLAQNNTQFHAEFLYLIMKYMAAPAGQKANNPFPVIPASKLLLGLPATTDAAGSGYTTPAVMKKAYNYFVQYNLKISGLMTWAVNYDAYNSWEFANQTYANTWGKA